MDMREVGEGSTLDTFHFEMWVGFLSFALSNDEMRSDFEKDTGTPSLPISLPTNGIEKMIDDACGVPKMRERYMEDFAAWATANHWGEECDISPSISRKLGAFYG